MRYRKQLAANLVLLICSISFGILLLEISSRFLFPISPGTRTLTLAGEPRAAWPADALRLPAGDKMRQVSEEYDVIVTTTDLGFRAPAPDHDPNVVFLGDSFTFGTGLEDDETFAFLYCKAMSLDCANLGRGGTGTHMQLNILVDFLKREKWQPKKVKLFLMTMTSALMGGNDLVDNINEIEAKENKSFDANQSSWEQILNYRRELLKYSNLARVVYFTFGPQIRQLLSPDLSQQRLEAALNVTSRELARFAGLGKQFGFQPELYIIHPVQDFLRGTVNDTVRAIRDITPEGMPLLSVAPALEHQPTESYYPFDGHLNSRGAAKVADFLVRQDAPKTSRVK